MRRFSSASSPSGPSEPGTHGTPCAFIMRIADTLSPMLADGLGLGADEHEAALLHALGEIGVLGQEAVAGVDGHRVGDFGSADDGGHVEIARAEGGGPMHTDSSASSTCFRL